MGDGKNFKNLKSGTGKIGNWDGSLFQILINFYNLLFILKKIGKENRPNFQILTCVLCKNNVIIIIEIYINEKGFLL